MADQTPPPVNGGVSGGARTAKALTAESDAQKVRRYEQAFDLILARPPYPVALRIAQEARHPSKDGER